MIKIDKNIPFPETTAGRPLKYPFDKMEVGHSFEYPPGKTKGSILWLANRWAIKMKNKRKFSVRTINGKFRLWRIK